MEYPHIRLIEAKAGLNLNFKPTDISFHINVIKELITVKKVDTFLFGSKSGFNSLCYETVTGIKEEYPNIKRVYVRAEYPEIDGNYEKYLLSKYEETYYPQRIKGAHKAVYIERNREMIDKSRFCVIYFDRNVAYKNRESGTKSALCYAKGKNRDIYLISSSDKRASNDI